MMTIISGLFREYCGNPCYNVCILGLEQTGKTTFANAVKNINASPTILSAAVYKPTIGLNITKYSPKKHPLLLWDLGGKVQLRKIWQNYYSECHGVIFVIDERVIEGLQVLKNIIEHQQMYKIPILILIKTESLKLQFQSLVSSALEVLSERAYRLQVYSPQIAINSQKINGILQWMYQEIHKLHLWIKKE